MATPEYQITDDVEMSGSEQEVADLSLCEQTRQALGNLATALIVTNKGTLLHNLLNIKPFN